jgi:HSP20 family molecular chaperone IbpA
MYINSQITDAVTQTLGSSYSSSSYTLSSIPAEWNTSGCFDGFPEFKQETEDGYKIIVCIPGCSKENVSVKYVPDENVVNLEAKSEVENFNRNYEASYRVPKKFNLEEIQCSLKNGLLTIFAPHSKNSKPKEVKIT